MAVTTPNMGLVAPQINDPSPGYVNNITTSLQSIDTHDHSTGKGVQVTPAGLNVNAAVICNGQALQTVRNIQFANQGSILNTLADAGSTFVFGGNLYYSSASGQPVQITSGAALVALAGGIGGDYATYGALINYVHSTKAYSFFDDTGAIGAVNTGALGVTGAAVVSGNLTAANVSATTAINAASAGISGTATIGTINATTINAVTTLTAQATANLNGTTNAGNIQLGTSGNITGGASSGVTASTFTAAAGGVTSDVWTYKSASTSSTGFWYYTPPFYGFPQGGAGFNMSYSGPAGVNVIHGYVYSGSYIMILRLPRMGQVWASSISIPYYVDSGLTATPTMQLIGTTYQPTYSPGISAFNPPSLYGGSLPAAVNCSTSQTTSWGAVNFTGAGSGPLTYSSPIGNYSGGTFMLAILITNTNTSAFKLHFGAASAFCYPSNVDQSYPGF